MTLNDQNKIGNEKQERRAAHTTLETVQIEERNAKLPRGQQIIVYVIGAVIVIGALVLLIQAL